MAKGQLARCSDFVLHKRLRLWVDQGIEPAVANVFDTDAVKAVVRRAQPEIVIEQLTALPRTYTRQSLTAAADFNTRIRVEGGARCAGGRASGRCAPLPEAVNRILGGFLALGWQMKERLWHLMLHPRWRRIARDVVD